MKTQADLSQASHKQLSVVKPEMIRMLEAYFQSGGQTGAMGRASQQLPRTPMQFEMGFVEGAWAPEYSLFVPHLGQEEGESIIINRNSSNSSVNCGDVDAASIVALLPEQYVVLPYTKLL
jgi:hypothetical protein